MNYSEIKFCDIANGVGVRTSLFVSGCRRHCKNCFNYETWSFTSGKPFDDEARQSILDSLDASYISGLTLLGGEPMEPENQEGLVDFLEEVKRTHPDKTIWLYTGGLLEDMLEGGKEHTKDTDRILATLDVMVDGPFVQELYDISLRFRGSSNQRILDIPKTLACGEAVLWEDDPMLSNAKIEHVL